jgi:hypothetical protein
VKKKLKVIAKTIIAPKIFNIRNFLNNKPDEDGTLWSREEGLHKREPEDILRKEKSLDSLELRTTVILLLKRLLHVQGISLTSR